MKKNKYKFSVIIPIFNSEKFIRKTLVHLKNQNFKNFEILIINDHSIDNSLKICKILSKKYKNISIFNNKKNLGVSISRNKGIKNAKGEYIIFLDSDDYLLNNSIGKINNFINNKKNPEIILFNRNIIKVGKKLDNYEYNSKITLKHKKINLNKIYKMNLPKECWGYIYNRKFIIQNKLNFGKNINFAEDQEFITKSITLAKKIEVYNKPYYCFRTSAGNLSNKMGSSPLIDSIKVVNNLCKLSNLKNININKKKFILRKAYVVLKEVTPRLVCINYKKILLLSKFVKKNLNNLIKLYDVSKEKNLIFFIKKFGVLVGILKFKKFTINEIIKLVGKSKNREIYIYCLNMYSIAISEILKDRNYTVKGFLDNNKYIVGDRIKKIEVLNPKILIRKNKKNILVILANQRKEVNLELRKQLINYKFNYKQIVHKKF